MAARQPKPATEATRSAELVGPGPYPKEWIIADVKPLPGWRLDITFKDGLRATIDVSDYLDGPVFEPLRDPDMFASGRFDPEGGSIEWPTGADFAPEFLRELAEATSP